MWSISQWYGLILLLEYAWDFQQLDANFYLVRYIVESPSCSIIIFPVFERFLWMKEFMQDSVWASREVPIINILDSELSLFCSTFRFRTLAVPMCPWQDVTVTARVVLGAEFHNSTERCIVISARLLLWLHRSSILIVCGPSLELSVRVPQLYSLLFCYIFSCRWTPACEEFWSLLTYFTEIQQLPRFWSLAGQSSTR